MAVMDGEDKAEDLCSIHPTDARNLPARDGFHADHAALLKRLLHQAADTYVNEVEHRG